MADPNHGASWRYAHIHIRSRHLAIKTAQVEDKSYRRAGRKAVLPATKITNFHQVQHISSNQVPVD
jgi:hypothetical protein